MTIKEKNKVYSVFMVGGKGKRLWPLSSKGCSKTFAPIGKRQPLILDSIKRVKKISPFAEVRFVVDKEHVSILKKTIKKITSKNIITEPFGRNTASAIGYAAINLPEDSIMAVFPSDASVDSDLKFTKTIKKGINFVNKNNKAIVCVGVKPDHPSIEYGYIECKGDNNICKVKNFTEKPTLLKAKKFSKSNNMFWNAGIFIFKTKTILEAIKKHAPKLHEKLMLIKKDKKNLVKEYKTMDNISIDYQIMEKYEQIYCVKSDFKWSDVGTWKTISDLFQPNKQSNILLGQNKLIDCNNVCIYGLDDKKIAIIGINNAVVVNTKEGLLVCDKNKIDKVNDIGWI